jgi:predicted nuclease of predicted toxin-antitoxin system
VKLLVDAQLPRRLARWLESMGHDARHTLELPDGNRTTDAEICRIARLEDRIVVTKDGDFARSHEISSEPGRLLLVSTGNMDNQALFALLRDNLSAVEAAFTDGRFVELDREVLIIHD